MKTVLPILLFLLCAAMKPSPAGDKLVGTWSYLNPETEETETIVFSENNTVMVIQGLDSMGGAEFYVEEMEIWCTLSYKTDYSKLPNHIDMKMIDLGSGEVLTAEYGIFQFLDGGNKLKVVFAETERPKNFDSGDVMTLKRIN